MLFIDSRKNPGRWNHQYPNDKQPAVWVGKILGGGNSNIFYVHPENGGRWTHFDLRIFLRWLGSTTNQNHVRHTSKTGVSNPRFEAVRMEVAAKLRVWGPCRPRKEGGGEIFPDVSFSWSSQKVRASWRYFLEIYWKLKYIQGYLGGGFKDFLLALKLGKGSQLWRAYFSDGLVQPPTSCVEMLVGKKEVVGWVKIYNGIKRKHVVIYFFNIQIIYYQKISVLYRRVIFAKHVFVFSNISLVCWGLFLLHIPEIVFVCLLFFWVSKGSLNFESIHLGTFFYRTKNPQSPT